MQATTIWDRLRGEAGDPLGKPLSRGRLRKLYDAGVIPRDALGWFVFRVEGTTPSPRSWLRFVSAHLLGLGVAFLGLAVTFFLAANWSALGGWTRIGLVATALAASGAVAARAGLETFAGRAALGLAGVLIGPLLAVYGQVFQTGADSFALFLLWAALLTPFIALVRWQGFFLVQVLLVEVGLALFLKQGLFTWASPTETQHVLAAPLALSLLGVELVGRWRKSRSRWLPRVLLFGTFLMLTPGTLATLGDRGLLRAAERSPLLALCAFTALVVWVYRRRVRDVFALGAAGLALTLMTACELFFWLDEAFRRDTFPLTLTGLFIMVSMGFVAAWVRRHLRAEDEDEDDPEDRWDLKPEGSAA